MEESMKFDTKKLAKLNNPDRKKSLNPQVIWNWMQDNLSSYQDTIIPLKMEESVVPLPDSEADLIEKNWIR